MLPRPFALVLAASCALAVSACGGTSETRVQSTYDPVTGKLARLEADSNGDGRVDTWTYMDGAVPIRTEQDLDGDGRIERWEYSRPDASAEKVAVSRNRNGKPDMWTYFDTAGEITRIEIAPLQGVDGSDAGRIERSEFYQGGRLVRVEEDTDADGRVDKWELHDGPTVLSADFDQDRDGKPDERVTFGPGGVVTARAPIKASR